jgi:hypothetical protein
VNVVTYFDTCTTQILRPDRVNNNQGQSTLLHLPAESRNQIFKYAFEDKVWEIISKIRFGGIVMKKEKNGLGLLGVCRQIYTETASIPYATSTFKFKYPPYLVFYPETYSLPVGSRSLQYILATVPMSGKTTISSSGRAMHFLPTFPRTEDCPCRLFLLAL